MVQFQGKKAMELSVNIIVMLVIGLTVLGLVISFVTNFLGSAEDQFRGSLSEDDENKLNQVERQQGNFAFLSGTIQVQKQSDTRTKMYMKIRNPTDTEFIFDGGEIIPGPPGSASGLYLEFSPGAGLDGSVDSPPKIFAPAISLENGDVGAYPLEIVAGEEVPPGSYYAEFTSVIGEDEYSQIVTIEVE